MQFNGFHHIAIRVADFDKAISFYGDGLGFEQKGSWGEGNSRAALMDTGNGNYIEVFAGREEAERPLGFCEHFAIRTDDVEEAVNRAVAAGAEITKEVTELTIPACPTPIPVTLAFVRTPTGEIVEFFCNDLT